MFAPLSVITAHHLEMTHTLASSSVCSPIICNNSSPPGDVHAIPWTIRPSDRTEMCVLLFKAVGECHWTERWRKLVTLRPRVCPQYLSVSTHRLAVLAQPCFVRMEVFCKIAIVSQFWHPLCTNKACCRQQTQFWNSSLPSLPQWMAQQRSEHLQLVSKSTFSWPRFLSTSAAHSGYCAMQYSCNPVKHLRMTIALCSSVREATYN